MRQLIARWSLLPMILIVSACSLLVPKFEKPTLSVAGVELVGGSLTRQNLRVTLNIQNPNDRALPVTRVHVELHVGGEEVATGINTSAFVVPARGDTRFEMNLTANLALLLLKVAGRSSLNADSIDYDMSGGASLDLPFMRDLPFRQRGSFPPRPANKPLN